MKYLGSEYTFTLRPTVADDITSCWCFTSLWCSYFPARPVCVFLWRHYHVLKYFSLLPGSSLLVSWVAVRRLWFNLIDFSSNTACRCREEAYSHRLWLQLLASSLLQGVLKSTGLGLRSRGEDKGMISVSDSSRGSPLQVRNAQSQNLKQTWAPFKQHNSAPSTRSAAACAFLPAIEIPLTLTNRPPLQLMQNKLGGQHVPISQQLSEPMTYSIKQHQFVLADTLQYLCSIAAVDTGNELAS